MKVANTVACDDTVTITAVQSFIVQAQGAVIVRTSCCSHYFLAKIDSFYNERNFLMLSLMGQLIG
jgi:hypothetical protein